MRLFNKNQITASMHRIGNRTDFQLVVFLIILVVMGNVNALVDSFLHPDIPYFDKEHLIVGGTSVLVSAALYGMLIIYIRHLNKAINTIKSLEKFLSICAHCHKIKKPDADPELTESWQPLEKYILEHTDTIFSHGICPQCIKEFYPFMTKNE